jgi:hypothetical protein
MAVCLMVARFFVEPELKVDHRPSSCGADVRGLAKHLKKFAL